ncbi:MAG: MarR family winged helix-turn-helix transcriptional regulator [Actinomycetota bacterium]
MKQEPKSVSRRTSPTREVEAVADRLHTAALHLLRRLRAEDDALGVSPPRLSALSVVVYAGPIGIGALAAAEGVTAPTMSRLIDGLERDGLVRRGPDPADARGVLVRATAKGTRTLTKGRRQRLEALASGLEGLSEQELAEITRGAELIERITREP